MNIQEKLNKQGKNYINTLAYTVKVLWAKACEFDNIDPKESFVIFSKENKFEKFYNIAVKQYWEARRQYACGGYVGLFIAKNK